MINKNTLLFIVILAASLSACATPSNSGVSKPTLFTGPLSYLSSFPLNRVSKNELVTNLGVPNNVQKLDDKEYLSYELGAGYGLKQYVYEITGDIITDVRYHDQGPYNGQSAKQRQAN